MKASLIVFIALAISVAVADNEINLDFIADANLTDASADFKFRWQFSSLIDTPAVPVPVPVPIDLPSKTFLWTSGSVDASVADASALANGDGIAAAAFPSSSSIFPFAVLASGKGQAALKFKVDDFFPSFTTLSATFNGGVVAMVALSMEERDPKGNYVDGTHVSFISTPTAIEEVNSDEGITGIICSENLNNAMKTNPVKAKISYLTSEKAGILKYGNAPVSPRSIEMIIQVENFKLTDKNNHIRLNIGFVDASGTGEISGNAEVVKKNGMETYVAVATHAVINDKATDVDVKVKTDALPEDLFSLASFNAVMQLTMSGDVDTRVATVDFPAGVQSFVYDPSAGTGANVYGKSSASTAVISLFVLLACSLFFLF